MQQFAQDKARTSPTRAGSSNSSPPPAVARFTLPVLLLLSGFCGISYEILYTRLLGNLLGNQFSINATVLLTFLLGIGLGTAWAHRLQGYLWAVEMGIGVYAALMAVFQPQLDHFLYARLPFIGPDLTAAAFITFAILLIPAVLIGCSLPLFAGYLAALRQQRIFSTTYALYNAGAAATALGMEFILLRAMGLRAATLLLSGLNMAVAVGLLALISKTSLRPARPGPAIRLPGRSLLALALASTASAIFQLLMLKVTEFILGPYNETFALVLAVVFMGLAAGAILVGRSGLSFGGALGLSLAGFAWLLAGLPTLLELYARFYPVVSGSYGHLVLMKLALVVALMALPALGFGATVPALLRTHGDIAKESGRLLYWSSISNALGFFLMAFFLHRILDYGPLLISVAALTSLASLIHAGRRRGPMVGALLLFGIALLAYNSRWDESLLYLGHRSFESSRQLAQERSKRRVAQRFKGPQDVFAILRKDNKPYFFINGYVSIPLSSSSEKIVGAVGAMMAPRHDRALVLGMGSGATAGTVALLYDRLDVVEINKVVLDNLHRMSQYNFDILDRENIRIIHDDGIHFIKTTPGRYSLILNTVTTPLYFSSSKLYTTDFLGRVVDRLTPDGVYVTWVDARIGDKGFDIILRTLAEKFQECWDSYLKSGYYLLTCANAPIHLHQYEHLLANRPLRAFLAGEYQTPLELLPYGVISTDAFSMASREKTGINTLDRPILEFEMAQLPPREWSLRGFRSRLKERLDLRPVSERLGQDMDWKPEAFHLYAGLRLGASSGLGKILDGLVSRQFRLDGERYDQLGLAYARSLNSAKGYQAFGKLLSRRHRWAAALQAFSQAADLRPSLEGLRFELARAYYGVGRFREAQAGFLKIWKREKSGKIPIQVAKSLIRQRRFNEALPWLDRAAEAGTSAERVAYYRGLVYEGSMNQGRARRQYRLALEVDPDSRRARQALRRMETR